jgi:hypothetical protein
VIAPGQLLSNPSAPIPVVRVVCHYPFDAEGAKPRWVVEHVNQPTHAVEIVRESDLHGYDLLTTMPLRASLDGRKVIA